MKEKSIENVRFLCFFALKSEKITGFVASRGVMINAAYIHNGVGGFAVWFKCCNGVRELQLLFSLQDEKRIRISPFR